MPKVVVFNYHGDMPWTHTALELVGDGGESHYYSLYPITHKELPEPLSGQEEDELSGKLLELWQRFIGPALGPIEGCFESKAAEQEFPSDTVALDITQTEYEELKSVCDQMKAEVKSGNRKYASIPLWGNNCGDFAREAVHRGLKHRPGADESLERHGTQQLVFLPNLFMKDWATFVERQTKPKVEIAVPLQEGWFKSPMQQTLPSVSFTSFAAPAAWQAMPLLKQTAIDGFASVASKLPGRRGAGLLLATASVGLFAARVHAEAGMKAVEVAAPKAGIGRP